MTTFLLVRHAQTEHTGTHLSGRSPGISLSSAGRREARELSRWLSGVRLGAVLTSPLQRARETAEMIAGRHGLQVQCRPDFLEVEYGDWTGRSIAELCNVPAFQQFNSARSSVHPPNGESALAVQERAVKALELAASKYAGQTIAVVTHAEVIRLTIAHYASIPLDFCLRIDIDPASISAISLVDGFASINCVNQVLRRAW